MRPSCSSRVRRLAAIRRGGIYSCRGTRALRSLKMSIVACYTYPLPIVLGTVVRASRDILDRWHIGVWKSSESNYMKAKIIDVKEVCESCLTACLVSYGQQMAPDMCDSLAMTRALHGHGPLFDGRAQTCSLLVTLALENADTFQYED